MERDRGEDGTRDAKRQALPPPPPRPLPPPPPVAPVLPEAPELYGVYRGKVRSLMATVCGAALVHSAWGLLLVPVRACCTFTKLDGAVATAAGTATSQHCDSDSTMLVCSSNGSSEAKAA